MNINKKSTYYFKNHLAWQIEPITETVYVLDKKNDFSYLFKDVSRDIWKMIHKKISIADIIDLLACHYDVSRMELEEDVILFIEKIIGEDLIYEL